MATTTVSARTLAEGFWYGLEQCGFLLADAVELNNSDRFPTALALALIATEEFGKSYRLLELCQKAANGEAIAAGHVKDVVRPKHAHERKQARALVSLTFGLAADTEINRLLEELGRAMLKLRDEKIEAGESAGDIYDQVLATPRWRSSPEL